jgi:hypothetical protein
LTRGLFAAPAGLTVERALPSFGFDDRQAATVSLPLFTKGVCFRLRGGILEQKAVWNVLAPSGGKVLLPETCGPAKPRKDRPDQVIFGLALVWSFRGRGRETIEDSAKISGPGHRCRRPSDVASRQRGIDS